MHDSILVSVSVFFRPGRRCGHISEKKFYKSSVLYEKCAKCASCAVKSAIVNLNYSFSPSKCCRKCDEMSM